MSRDAATIYADLHEAMRCKRIAHFSRRGLGRTPDEFSKIDPERVAYDFSDLVIQWCQDAQAWDRAGRQGLPDIAAMRNHGFDLAAEDRLVSDRCALVWSQPNPPEPLEQVVFIDRCYSQHTGFFWILHTFEQHVGNVIGSTRCQWACSRAAIMNNDWAFEGERGQFTEEGDEAATWIIHLIFACCGALAQGPELVEATSSTFTAMNFGRARGRLAPVPPVRRILDLQRKVYRSNREHEATGREMPFHFRRGSHRTFRADRYKAAKGKTVTVPGGWVRKDKAPPGDLWVPPIYTVES